MREAAREFRRGKKGNIMIWIVAGAGFIASLFALIISFMPPKQIETGSKVTWYIIMISGSLIVVTLPFIILAFKKKSWKSEDSAIVFKPFHWEK